MYLVPIFLIIGSNLQFVQDQTIDKLLSDISNVHHEYNCVQLVNKEMMGVVGYILFYLHGIYGQFCLYCNFTIIKEWDQLGRYTRVNTYP